MRSFYCLAVDFCIQEIRQWSFRLQKKKSWASETYIHCDYENRSRNYKPYTHRIRGILASLWKHNNWPFDKTHLIVQIRTRNLNTKTFEVCATTGWCDCGWGLRIESSKPMADEASNRKIEIVDLVQVRCTFCDSPNGNIHPTQNLGDEQWGTLKTLVCHHCLVFIPTDFTRVSFPVVLHRLLPCILSPRNKASHKGTDAVSSFAIESNIRRIQNLTNISKILRYSFRQKLLQPILGSSLLFLGKYFHLFITLFVSPHPQVPEGPNNDGGQIWQFYKST